MPSDLLVDAFFQADTIRGYRYLDDAGKIMNRWDSFFPEKSVGLEGLTMTNKGAVMRQLRVDARTIWLHLHIPDNIQQVESLVHDTATGVSEIIAVEQFRRIGLRLQFVYGVQSADAAIPFVVQNLYGVQWLRKNDLLFWKNKGFEFMVPLPADGISVNLRVSLVRRDPKTPVRKNIPIEAIMIDLDLFRHEVTDIRDLKGILGKVLIWLDQGLPNTRDNVLQGVQIDNI